MRKVRRTIITLEVSSTATIKDLKRIRRVEVFYSPLGFASFSKVGGNLHQVQVNSIRPKS